MDTGGYYKKTNFDAIVDPYQKYNETEAPQASSPSSGTAHGLHTVSEAEALIVSQKLVCRTGL